MSLRTSIGLVVLITIVFIPIFTHLDVIPIQLWDESLFTSQAMEMMDSHNWIVTTYHGQPDMWFTKPPMMVWLQILFLKVFGYSELSVRLPSALAASGTCLLIFRFFVKGLKNPLPGLIAVTVLVTTPGYIVLHGTRSGECDSLLTMFTTGYTLLFFLYFEEKSSRYLSMAFVFLILAGLTKGVAALLFAPALLFYAIYKKMVLSILREKQFYIGIAAFLLVVPGYYLLREHYTPGFINAVFENELGGRYSKVIEGNEGSSMHYVDLLTGRFFNYWYLLLLPGILTGVLSKDTWIRNLTIFSTISAGTYLIIISGAQTKLDWYLVPIYPFFSILIAVFLLSIFKVLSGINEVMQIMSYNILPYVFLFLVFITPYQSIYSYVMADKGCIFTAPDRTNMLLFLQNILKSEDKNMNGVVILSDGIAPDLEWYYRAFQKKQKKIKVINRDEIDSMARIVVFQEDSKQFLEQNYDAKIVYVFRNVVLYKLNGKRAATSSVAVVN